MFLFVYPTNIILAAIHHAKTACITKTWPGPRSSQKTGCIEKEVWTGAECFPFTGIWFHESLLFLGGRQLLVSHDFIHGWLQLGILLSRFQKLSKKSRSPISPHHCWKDNIGWIFSYQSGLQFWIFSAEWCHIAQQPFLVFDRVPSWCQVCSSIL